MLSYEDLYEFLRKEKYSDNLQELPKDFIEQFADYMKTHRHNLDSKGDLFSDEILREKKQYENSMTLFKELILRRKKKILNLVFVAAETGVMKRDFETLLTFEQSLFDHFIKAIHDADNSMSESLKNGNSKGLLKEVLIKEDVEEFVDMQGDSIGPFKKGDRITLDENVAGVLVNGERAMFVE